MHRLAALVLPLVLGTSSQAATYDPDLTWRTIVTDHFRIHFHQGEEQLADEFSRTVEEVYDTMTEELRWMPRRRTHVVLIDRTDAANGFAGSVPYNAITIFVTGPDESSQLADYEDWFTGIQTHEFTHTLHIDTNHGVARAARWVVGRISSTNRLSPAWVVEGLATFEETGHTNGGRGRTPVVDMILRTAALEDDIPPLGRMDGFQAQPPSGAIRYLFGQDFIQHVADHHGPEVWTRFVHTYGSSVPYLLPGRFVLGGPFHVLHREWAADLRTDAWATVDRIELDGPISEATLLSSPLDSCRAPAFSPTGDRLVWSCYSPRFGNQIWSANPDGSEPEKLIQDRGASRISFRSDGKAFAYAGTHVVNRFNTWSDLYLYDLESEKVTALTRGARARDPDFSADGQRLFMVTNAVQNNQIEVSTVDRSRRALTDFTDHTQLSTPVISPDGRILAASVWRDGRRDLWLLDPEDGSFERRLTMDDAIDREPRWSADGSLLYFASDRTGIPQVFAIDVQTERLWQVSNVPTGAVHPAPSPDGARIAWQEYHAKGWRIALQEIDRSTWIDRGVLPRPLRHGAAIADLTMPRSGQGVAAESVGSGEPGRWCGRGGPVSSLQSPVSSPTAAASGPACSVRSIHPREVHEATGSSKGPRVERGGDAALGLETGDWGLETAPATAADAAADHHDSAPAAAADHHDSASATAADHPDCAPATPDHAAALHHDSAPVFTGLPLSRRRAAGVPIDPVAGDLPGLGWRPSVGLPGALPVEAFAQDAGGTDSFDQTRVEDAFGAEQDYPFAIEPRRYAPLGALLPRYWVPFIQNTNFPSRKPFAFLPLGLYASASTGSVDPVRHYAWSAALNYRTDAAFLGGGASFVLNRWIPVYALSISRAATTPSVYYVVSPDDPTVAIQDPDRRRYWQSIHTVTASMDYPYTFKTSLYLRYQLSLRESRDPVPDDVVAELLPIRGAIGTIQGGWRYAWSQPTAMAISAEDGRVVSVTGGLIHPWLGAYSREPDGSVVGIRAAQLTAELREYRVMPWGHNQVLAMRLGAGAALGTDRYLGLYQLGGNLGESAFYVTPASERMLRGFLRGADTGDAYWLASLEYRVPLLRIDGGFLTWPAFIRAFSAHAFVDAGNAFSPTSWGAIIEEPLVGVGGELRLSTILWYGVGTTFRVGVATGLTGPNAIPRTAGTAGQVAYFRLGGSF